GALEQCGLAVWFVGGFGTGGQRAGRGSRAHRNDPSLGRSTPRDLSAGGSAERRSPLVGDRACPRWGFVRGTGQPLSTNCELAPGRRQRRLNPGDTGRSDGPSRVRTLSSGESAELPPSQVGGGQNPVPAMR